MKTYCGIDPGLTGFCVAVFSYKSIVDWLFIATSSEYDLQSRIETILVLLRNMLQQHKITEAKIEIPVYGANANAFFMQVSLYQAILDMCKTDGMVVQLVPVRPTQAKMHLDKGNISKTRVYEIFKERFGLQENPFGLTKLPREGLLDAIMIGMYEEDLERFNYASKTNRKGKKRKTVQRKSGRAS